MTMGNIKSYGAVGDGVSDDRAAIQSAINAATPADPVWVPTGIYRVGQAAGEFACLLAKPGIQILGESRTGSIIRAADGLGPSCSVLRIEDAPDVVLRDLTIDGNRAGQDVNQWRHGAFVKRSPRLSVCAVTFVGAGGDGIEIYDGSDDAIVTDVLCTANTRNGLTLGGGTTGGVFYRSQFTLNGAEQFDCEGGPVHHVTIRGCLFDAEGASEDHVLTMTGSGAGDGARSRGWVVVDNVVNGSALILWIDDVIYARNTGINPTVLPSVYVYRRCENIRIAGNVLHTTAPAAFDAGALVHVLAASSPGQASAGVRIEGNALTTTASATGISAIGARDILIADNKVRGGGGGIGMFVRAILPSVPTESVIIERNSIIGFSDHGLYLGGNGVPPEVARILNTEIVGNTFDRPLMLGDDNNTAMTVTVADNGYDGPGHLVTRAPGGAPESWATGTRWTPL